MNPGGLSLLVMFIFAILFVTGWGTRYILESGMGEGKWSVLLLALGIGSSFDMHWETVRINLAVLLLGMLTILYFFWKLQWRKRLYFLVSMITIASLVFILMNLVPHDPAFYLLDGNFLYPLAALLVGYTFSRKPLFVLQTSLTGIMLAGVTEEYRASYMTTGVLTIGSPELVDLVSTGLLIGFLSDQLIHLVEIVAARINRSQKQNLEGDPT
jgi:hypothetical protein